jgi:imidazolonepropionase
VVSTYLSAHAVPLDSSREAYLDWIEESLGEFVRLAEFFDVFCEDGAFTLNETVRLLTAARAAGFKLKAHAGQLSDKGAAGAAAGLGSVSCDHLEKISDDQMAAMKRSGTAAVLLPGVPFFLGTGEYPDGRRLLEAGLRVALATDFNPGSCPCFSMQMIIALAVFECGMSVSEALAAATVNGALALDRGGISGCLAPGFQADIAVLDVETPEQIPYHFGGNLVSCVFKNGERIFEGSKVKRSGDEF